MRSVPLDKLVRYGDRVLRPDSFKDWDGAWNGLQVANRGQVRRIAAAVDARRATVEQAIARGADLLVVHHGLFWGGTVPWTGARYALLQLLVEHNLAIYSSHLPLDAHPRLGNNVLLAGALGLQSLRPFFECKGRKIGVSARMRLPLGELARRLQRATSAPPKVLAGGPATTRCIGIVTGGAGAEMAQAAAEGVDTFVTGEGPHWTHALADDLGINVLYGGHYATETFGVKALAANLSARFGVPWEFIDYPTGL